MAIVTTSSTQQVAQALPERSQIVTQGASWEAGTIVGPNTFTAAAAFPTTTTSLYIYNTDATKTYIIDSVKIFLITSSTAGGISIITTGVLSRARCNSAASLVTPSGTLLPVIGYKSLSGKASYGGNAIIGVNSSALTLTPALAATDWMPIANLAGAGAAATTLGSTVEAVTYGKYLVGPGMAMGFNAEGASAAGTYGTFITWHEVLLTVL